MAWEDAARASAPQLLILDTHLLKQLLGRSYDLHLLLSPQGVDWISDGQRAYQVLDGDWQQRREQAMAAVSNLLGPSADLMLVQQTVEGRSRNP